jgi:hypothetical protein
MQVSKQVILFLGIVMIFFLQSCNSVPDSLVPSEYVKWIKNEENGLTKTKSFNNLHFTATYKPIEFIICNEERTNELSAQLVEERSKKLDGLYHFGLRLKTDLSGDVMAHEMMEEEQYFDRVAYYGFEFQNDIMLVQNLDTLHCGLFNFVRSHGIAPYVDFVFSFPKSKDVLDSDLQLVVNDKVFNNGIIKFVFDHKIINNLPQLITL